MSGKDRVRVRVKEIYVLDEVMIITLTSQTQMNLTPIVISFLPTSIVMTMIPILPIPTNSMQIVISFSQASIVMTMTPTSQIQIQSIFL